MQYNLFTNNISPYFPLNKGEFNLISSRKNIFAIKFAFE